MKYLFRLFCTTLLLYPGFLLGQVESPNYDFSLDQIKSILPDSKIEDVKKTFPDLELITDTKKKKVFKVKLKHQRYIIHAELNVVEDLVRDIFIRLPSYFLHDVFHQSLINRYGKQNFYKLKNEHAIYIWDKLEKYKIVYSSTCTIQCFPIYLAIISKNTDQLGEYISIFDEMNKSYILELKNK
ncbi:MAG: hypothetical protein H6622_01295 [Halobacteriovoraceae bacterium]|nr:hypothetical protein [Halobacteriovoraceae bacterium]